MQILVCNDDGVTSPLIKALAISLKRYGKVLVCAPEGERSAYSQSIDYRNHDIKYLKDLGEEDGVRYMSHPHTPTDSLLYVLDYVSFKPDLVVSGINRGLNVGIDIYYSGTVGIATEACLRGYKSFAISIHKDYKEEDLRDLDSIIDHIIKEKLYSNDYVLNVNMPINYDKVEYQYTSIGVLDNYTNTDIDAVENKKVSLTPIMLDRTDVKTLKKINK